MKRINQKKQKSLSLIDAFYSRSTTKVHSELDRAEPGSKEYWRLIDELGQIVESTDRESMFDSSCMISTFL